MLTPIYLTPIIIMTYNDIFQVFEKYNYSHPQSHANQLDLYLRALCQCMLDHANEPISADLILKIYTEAEYYKPIDYDSAWYNISFPDDNSEEYNPSFADTILILQALIADNRRGNQAFAEQFKHVDLDKVKIPYYQYKGQMMDWNNPSVDTIIDGLEAYIRDRHKEIPTATLSWYLIVDLLMIGIMYV